MEELTLIVPDSWNEITLGQFQEMSLIDQSMKDIDKVIEVFSILTEKDPAELTKLPLNTVTELASMLAWTAKAPAPTFERAITIDNEVYAIVPRLEELTLGEWVDLENYAADLMNNLHYFLAILYRPVVSATKNSFKVEDYDSKSMIDRAELFKERMLIGQVYGATVFFSLIGMQLLPSLKDYLEQTLNPQTTS